MAKNIQYRKNKSNYYTKLGFDIKREYPLLNGGHIRTVACYYCGEPSESKDHVFPLSALDAFLTLGAPLPPRVMFIVPSCLECNSLLSSKVFDSIDAKKDYLKKRLKEKYLGLLKSPKWSQEDLEDLGYNLRTRFEAMEAKKFILRERLDW